MSTFSPSDAALEGFRLTRERPGSILTWCGVYSLGILAIAGVMIVGIGPKFIAFLKDDSLQTADPATVAKFGGMLAQSWPAFVVALLIAIFVLGVLTGGIYRLVLRPQEPGFAHLRLGADEARLAVTHLLLVCIVLATLLVTELALAVVLQALGGGRRLAILLTLVSVLPMAWVGVRLSLATPLAFDQKRISIPAAWRLTRGRFWPLLGMILLSLLFYIMIYVLFLIISFVIVQLAGGEQAIAASAAKSAGALAAFAVVMAIQLLLPILQAVMGYAPLAVAYRALRQP
jgi:hypothetical protein